MALPPMSWPQLFPGISNTKELCVQIVYYNFSYLFIYLFIFVLLGFELRAYTLNHFTSPSL
jgi:hypothetical protein